MPLWMTIILALGGSALISATVNFIFNSMVNSSKKKKQMAKDIADEMERRDEITRRALQSLLRHELYELYETYSALGYAPIDVKVDFDNLYQNYHNLGKNGVMDATHERFMQLPDTPKSKKQKLNG